jgi:hypothetical protein
VTNIVSSTFTTDPPQADGRCWVHETHVDVSGASHHLDWLAPSDVPANSLLNEHAGDLDNQLRNAEVETNLAATSVVGVAAKPTYVFSTLVDLLEWARTSLSSMTPADADKVATFIIGQSMVDLYDAYGMDRTTLSALQALPTTGLGEQLMLKLGLSA